MYKLFYKTKEINNQKSKIDKLIKEKSEMNIQITNSERFRENLIQKYEEELQTKLIIKLIIIININFT